MVSILEMKWIKNSMEFYAWALRNRDPRTQDWPFVSSAFTPITCVIIYLAVVLTGPKIMKSREPLQLMYPMVLYNTAMTTLNFYIFLELVIASTKAGYSYTCQPVNYTRDPNEMGIASALWWYYISKIIEFLDTIFFILRKKDNQVTFLHVYHHSSMVALWWIGISWVPGGQSFFGATINCVIHVIMYTYYALSAVPSLRKYLWWKRYLTQMQLIQFCVVLAHCIGSLYFNCNFPRWMAYANISYMVSFLLLFSNFYIRAYFRRERTERSQEGKKIWEKTSANGRFSENGDVREKEKKTQ